jgi:quercetin dioxygenase-like cupin family protein
MSGTIVIRNLSSGGESVANPSGTFTGDVYFDMLHMDDKIGVASMTFTPGARTLWHIHEEGQVLKVVGGSGWICDKDGVPQRL